MVVMNYKVFGTSKKDKIKTQTNILNSITPKQMTKQAVLFFS